MADIIERSLELSVVGVDEASDVFAAIADQVDDLQERFQTAFAGMQDYAIDSASAIADAANSWAPVWISQLEAIETAAADTFSTLEATFSEAGASGAEAGSTVESAWLGTLSTLSDTTGAAADAGSALADLGADGAAAGEQIAGAFASDNLGIDSASGSISELDDQLLNAGADAAEAGKIISTAFDTDNLGIDAASGSISDLDGQMKTAGDSVGLFIGRDHLTDPRQAWPPRVRGCGRRSLRRLSPGTSRTRANGLYPPYGSHNETAPSGRRRAVLCLELPRRRGREATSPNEYREVDV